MTIIVQWSYEVEAGSDCIRTVCWTDKTKSENCSRGYVVTQDCTEMSDVMVSCLCEQATTCYQDGSLQGLLGSASVLCVKDLMGGNAFKTFPGRLQY